MADRRGTLAMIAGAALSACVHEARPPDGRGAVMPAIGVQLYMLRDLLASDVPGTLEALAGLGIRHVELAGYHGLSPTAWHTLLRDNGLIAVGTHGLYPDMTDAQVAIAIEEAATLDITWLVAAVPRLPGLRPPITEESFRAATQRMTRDDLLATADRFNSIAMRVRAAGMRFAYHSHGFDFRRYPDGPNTAYGLDIILRHTDPALVALELDVGNTIAAGVDPMPYIISGGRQNPRLALAHVKDWEGHYVPSLDTIPPSRAIGEGSIAWHPIMIALERAGVTDVFIEQENVVAGEALRLLARNVRGLRRATV